jgi:crossover junction endodeoxyribonuclease RusA
MISLSLPYPPTTNNLYRNTGGRGRVKTEHYKAWLNEAGWLVKAQRPAPLPGRYRLSLVATAPDARRRDVDNLLKPVSDLLKACGVIEEDSLAKSVFAEWSDEPPCKPGALKVVIEAYAPQGGDA